MPSENAAASLPQLPRDLQPDHSEFLRALASPPGRAALDPEAIARLTRFGHLVYSAARELSLVAKGDRPSIFTRHVLDSLNPLALFGTAPAAALDIGSGGGFPGIPLAIAWPDTTVTLLESRERKAGFLERVVRVIGLRNVRVVCARLEEYGKAWRAEPQALVFVRAVGSLPELLRAAAPACAEDARWVYFLGGSAGEVKVIAALEAKGLSARVEAGSFGGRMLYGDIPRRATDGSTPD